MVNPRRGFRDMAEGIWATLGIGRTDDERAIRTAYAARQKTIDVDRDAAGFIALRSAYEAALASARGVGATNWLDAPHQESPQRPDAPGGAPQTPLAGLAALFHQASRQNRRWLSKKLDLRRCWAAIAAEAEASDMTRYAAIEQEVRWLIVDWGALSVGLVPFAVEFFHWDSHSQLASDGTVAEILWRYHAIQFLRKVRQPGHSHHPAWAELTSKYFPGSARGRCPPLLVHELQAIVRDVWPEVETEFDPGRVALWRNNTADPAHPENPETRPIPRWLQILFTIIVGFWLIRIGGGVFVLVVGWVLSLFG